MDARAGVLAVVLPELEATVDFSQEAGRRHKDVWEHTKQVVVSRSRSRSCAGRRCCTTSARCRRA